ncbi:AraC family transcriptional regulator [Zobellia uliginosa]|nr:AraC family transcriptional regulator [Zobellia uliginosa]
MDATIVIGEDALGDVENQNGVLENGELHIKVDFVNDCGEDVRVYSGVFEKGLNLPAILLDALHSLSAKIKMLESGADRNISRRFQVIKGKAGKIISTGGVGDKEKIGHPKPMVDLSMLKATDRAFVEKVIDFVEENISDDTYWVDDLSFDMNTSRSTFFRKLKKITGHAPKDFMRNLRLMKAGELLSSEELRIAEVSYQVGFSDPNYFSKCFRKFYGTSPSDYIEMNRAS